MTSLFRRARLALILAAFSAFGVVGCNDNQMNSSGNRTDQGAGEHRSGSFAPGTNASTGELTTTGPGSQVVGQKPEPPSGSTPSSKLGSGTAPPVTPESGAAPSGDSNSGQQTGKQNNIGADASTEAAKPTPR